MNIPNQLEDLGFFWMATLPSVARHDEEKWRQIRLRHGEERSSMAIQKTGLSIREGYILKFFWILLLTCEVLKAENFSIMLSLAEQEALHQAQGLDQQILDKVWGSETIKGTENKLNQDIIFLSAILYFSPDKWTVILNDQIITAQGYSQGVWLKSVTPDQVIFSLEEQTPLEFSLRINQSFLAGEKRIMEGDQRNKTEVLGIDKDSEKGKSEVKL